MGVNVNYNTINYRDQQQFDYFFATAFDRYHRNRDGRIDFWELGTYGHWGEYHMTYVNKTLQATDETKKKILKMNLKYFRKTLSLIRKPEKINKNESLGYYHD